MEITRNIPNIYVKNFEVGNVYRDNQDDSLETSKLKKACRDFESFFLSYMMKTMDKTVGKSDLMNGGRGEDIFKDMKSDALATEAVKGNGLGFAQVLYKDVSRYVKMSS